MHSHDFGVRGGQWPTKCHSHDCAHFASAQGMVFNRTDNKSCSRQHAVPLKKFTGPRASTPCTCCFSTSKKLCSHQHAVPLKNFTGPRASTPCTFRFSTSKTSCSHQHAGPLKRIEFLLAFWRAVLKASTCMLARAVASRRMQSHQHNEVLSFLTFGTNSRSPPQGLYVSS